jgi:hypothetical protein
MANFVALDAPGGDRFYVNLERRSGSRKRHFEETQMANFVALDAPGGDRFYVNLERIIYIKLLANGHSRIFFSSDASLDIALPPEEIL